MATAVTIEEIDQLNGLIDDANRGDAAMGLLVMSRLSQIARDLTRWQWVMHGDTGEYRSAVVRWQCRNEKLPTARRFALCGRGDCLGVEVDGPGVRVRSKGCGCRYCPRCSRKAGRKYLKRVNGHLSSRPHGELLHMVFTQRAKSYESLADCRARFEGAWKKCYRRMQKAGMRGGLATYHLVRNSANAWHWHCHVIVELRDDVSYEGFEAACESAWRSAKGPLAVDDAPLWSRRVCGKGLAFDGLRADTQMDFWAESQSEVEKALQYCIRDVLQGVERWIANVRSAELAEEFASGIEGAKMHRLLGEWRKPLDAKEITIEADAKNLESGAAKPGEEKKEALWNWLGGVDDIIHQASLGVTVAVAGLMRLVEAGSNRSLVAQRLRRVAQCIQP